MDHHHHIFLNPKVSIELANYFKWNAAKLTVIDTPASFNNFLLEKSFFLLLYQTNLIFTGLSLPLVFVFPLLCVLSVSFCLIFLFILVSKASIAKANEFSFLFSGIPCTNRQLFLLEYYCLSLVLNRPLFTSDKSLFLLSILIFFFLVQSITFKVIKLIRNEIHGHFQFQELSLTFNLISTVGWR